MKGREMAIAKSVTAHVTLSPTTLPGQKSVPALDINASSH